MCNSLAQVAELMTGGLLIPAGCEAGCSHNHRCSWAAGIYVRLLNLGSRHAAGGMSVPVSFI